MKSYRYSRWDGTQQYYGPDEDYILDALSDDIMSHGDIDRAMRSLFRDGISNERGERVNGLSELRERLQQMGQDQLERFNLDSLTSYIKDHLQDIIDTERNSVESRLNEAQQQLAEVEDDSDFLQEPIEIREQRTQQNLEMLETLAESTAGRIKELKDYEFIDPDARQEFQDFIEMLNQQMMQNYFQGMKVTLQSMSAEDVQRLQDMIQTLNRMLRDRTMDEDTDFKTLMEQYGSFFDPDHPPSLNELIEHIQRQMASIQSLMGSISPQTRNDLDRLMESAMDLGMMQALSELASAVYEMFPFDDMVNDYPFMGNESLTLAMAMELMEQLQDMNHLDKQIQSVMQKGNVQDLNPDQVEKHLGEDARRQLEQIQQLVRQLEEAGYLQRDGGRLELTPRGMRMLAQQALREVFSEVKKDRIGRHEVYIRGSGVETTGNTKQYEFGDPFNLNLHRTLFNSVLRNGSSVPLRLSPEDFEINRTEHLTQSATVLLLDQSKSMGMFGSWESAKKVALALYSLISSQFPRDHFSMVGFSDYAMEINPKDLPEITWNNWVSGTNIQHGLMLAHRMLSSQKVTSKQIIMITDGEPTAHLEDGQAYFSYPSSYRTIEETLKEVKRCTLDGVTINTFMLESNDYLMGFVDKMTRINKGRAFYTTSAQLGKYVMVDYLRNRRNRVG
ncbi:VWA domain-containing protein [Dehalococcoidia bacterium]|nr:VWA domain-containing protein [Dehalococcoidia bacterium]